MNNARIGDIAFFQKGFAFKSKDYQNKGVRIIRVTNLNKNDFSDNNCIYIDPDIAVDYEKYSLRSNDAVISTVGSWPTNPDSVVGKVCIIPKGIDGSLLNQNSVRLRAKEGCRQLFLNYTLRNKSFSKYIVGTAQGSANQASITLEDIRNYEFFLPEVEVQDKIISILNNIDKKITTNNEINQNLEQQAATVFLKWLSCCTERITIGELSNNILDYTPISNEQIRLLNSSDVTEGVFPISQLVPNKDLKGHFKKRFKTGDVLYSEIRPRNHHYGYVLFDATDYYASTRLMVIRAKEELISPEVLYQYLLLPSVEAEFTLKTESRSGTFPQGNYADMATIEVPFGPKDSQCDVAIVLARIRQLIYLNQKENQHLAELRDMLLPKLMSGELDVSDIDV